MDEQLLFVYYALTRFVSDTLYNFKKSQNIFLLYYQFVLFWGDKTKKLCIIIIEVGLNKYIITEFHIKTYTERR